MRYFEDYQVGEILKLGTYEVSEEEIISYARKYDPQTYHTDPVGARDTCFNGLVASGWMTGSICMRLMCDAFILESKGMGSPGFENLRWTLPVRPGDVLTGTCEIMETRPSSKGKPQGTVKYNVILVNQNNETVMTTVSSGIYASREDTSTITS